MQASDAVDGNGGEATGHASVEAYPAAIVSATDAASGVTVTVDRNGRGLTATDRAGRTLWRTDVLGAVGDPYEGRPVIRHVALTPQGAVSIVIGKDRVAEADLATGSVRLLGED